MDDPQKQEGFYSAVVSNIFGSNQSITYLTYHCKYIDTYCTLIIWYIHR